MKRFTILMVSLFMAVGLVGCGKKEIETIPALNKVNKDTQEQQLKTELVGKTREDLNDAWGKPDSMLSGADGEIWLLDDNHIVIVYYNYDDDIIEDVAITTNDFPKH